MRTSKKPARMTSPEERAPLYAAYAASRSRGEQIGYHCPDDSIIQHAVRAYDREKYGTEALALPNWLVDLIAAANASAEGLSCDELGHQCEDCARCTWSGLYNCIPERTRALAAQALALRSVATAPYPGGEA